MRVLVEHSKCMAAGLCALALPKVFEQRDDGLSSVLQEEVTHESEESVREAASACPSRAIRIVEP